MLALYIICGIVLFFALLLNFSLRARIRLDEGVLDFKLRYIFFTLYPRKKKKKPKMEKKRKKRRDKSAKNRKKESRERAPVKPDENAEAEPLDGEDKILLEGGGGEKKGRLKSLLNPERLSAEMDKISNIKDKCLLVLNDPHIKKGLRKTYKSVSIKKFTLDFTVCGADAFEAAMNYGKVSAVTYNAISAVMLVLPVSVKSVDIVCDFDGKQSRYNGGGDVKLKVSRLIGAGVSLLIGVYKNRELISQIKERKEQ